MTTKKNYFERNRSGDKWGCDLFLEKYLNTLPFIGNNDGSSSNNNTKATTDVWGQRIRDIDSADETCDAPMTRPHSPTRDRRGWH